MSTASPTSPISTPLLELANVTAFYGDLQALFGVSLRVMAGEIVALIGANGAGKTTILRVVSGIKHPGGGSLCFAGEDVARVPAHEMVARGVSHVPEGRQVFPFLTVKENLSLGAYAPRVRKQMKQLVEEVFEKIQEVRRSGITMLIVEQNVVSALSISDRGYVVQNGAVLLEDTAKNLLANEMVRAAYLGV